MNKSLSSEDFELVLDNQHVPVPAMVKETLMNADIDAPLDCATYSGDYCWVVRRQDAFAWNVKNQNVLNYSNRCAHLGLPGSGLGYNSHLVKVYEKAKGQKEASVLAISREGNARHWSNMTKKPHIDSVLNINHEVVMCLHLLDCGSDNSPTVFIMVTTYGSIYKVDIAPDGTCTSELLGSREQQGITGKLSNFLFGSSNAVHTNHVTSSLIYWREGEEVEDEDEETKDAVVVTVGPNILAAFDVPNKAFLWTTDTKSLIGHHITKDLEKKTKTKLPDVKVTSLDIQTFKDGCLLLAAASYDKLQHHTHYLVYLTNFDYRTPKVTYLQEIKNGQTSAELYELLLDENYMNQAKLAIPRETAQASSLFKTDGIFILHPSYVQSVYLPDDLTKNGELPVNKHCSLSSDQQLIGYGVDEQFCYVMTANAKTATLRLLPTGFNHNTMDDLNIHEVIANLPVPEGNNEAMDLYQAFVEFCEKNLTKSSILASSLTALKPQALLQLIHTFVWSFFEEIKDHQDVDVELREKKKFLDYFILFLKHNEVLSEVFSAKMINPRVNIAVFGSEIFAELYERIQVLLNLYKWKNACLDHADVLRHVGIQLAKDLRLRDTDGQFLAFKFTLLHMIPQSGVNLCKNMLNNANFKEISQRYEMLCYSAELLVEMAQTITVYRNAKSAIPTGTEDGNKWTRFVAQSYSDLAMVLAKEIGDENYQNNEKLKFAQYIAKLLGFHFTELGEKPEGHDVMRYLRSIGEERLALELADRFKDFNTICRMCLEKDDVEALQHFKKRFADDNFEQFYLQYLNRKQLYTELLQQTGEQAEKYITSLDHVRWRRELQKEQYSEAGKTLLMESEKRDNTLRQHKLLTALAKLSYLCAENSQDHAQELEDIYFHQNRIEYQEILPEYFLNKHCPDKKDRLLSTMELVDLCKLRMKDRELSPYELIGALTFITRLLKKTPNRADYWQVRQAIWEASVHVEDWSKVDERHLKSTAFAVLFHDLLKEHEDWIALALPDCDLLLKNTVKDRQKCAASREYIRYCIEQTRKEIAQ